MKAKTGRRHRCHRTGWSYLQQRRTSVEPHIYTSCNLLRNLLKDEPTGKLGEAIKRDFGSFENFKKEFNAAAVGLFGSGWAWLSVDKNGKLHITKEANGSNPVRAGLETASRI